MTKGNYEFLGDELQRAFIIMPKNKDIKILRKKTGITVLYFKETAILSFRLIGYHIKTATKNESGDIETKLFDDYDKCYAFLADIAHEKTNAK